MSGTAIGIFGIGGLLGLIFLRVPVGIALALTGTIGFIVMTGFKGAFARLGSFPFDTAYSADLTIIPLFILMGNFAMVSGMSRELYAMAQSWVGHWRGGLASATIVACAGFAAVSGSSLASAVTMGRVALPEMKRFGYHARLATGAVAAGGTLGILIPPSTGFIIFALITEESVGRLFLAGILPGLLLTALFMATIAIMTYLRPDLGPAAERSTWEQRATTAGRSAPLLVIVVMVLGGIYVGVFSPIEAAAVGAFLTFVVALGRRTLTFGKLQETVLETIKITGMVMLIVVGAFIFNPFFALTGIPRDLGAFVGGLDLPPVVIMGIIVLVFMVLGTFLEGIAMLVLTLPIVFPIVTVELGFDPIWFGVIMVLVLEMSLISPPLGLNVFVVKGISDGVPMSEIFKGVIPFWLAMILCVIILFVFPQIALILPDTMIGSRFR